MTETQLSYAMRNVPRYTSYPTAPHFHAGVDGNAYSRWLESLTPDDSLSLYLHVPFCREICHYCGCHTKATRQDAPLVAYAKTLSRELELVASHLKASGPVRHIHWGGGTPSLLPEQSLIEIAGMLRVLFNLAPDVEHAIELDPRYVTISLSDTLARIGVNRASLGIQDLDLTVQKAIGRVQSYEVVKTAVSRLRAAGLNDLNFDLMYGLPHQTLRSIRETVARTIELRPGRIALFGYAHVPWMKKHQRLISEDSLPGSAERMELADAARSDLLAAGYRAIGLDHFALPDDSMAIAEEHGELRRNFQGYTTDSGEQLLGFGVSSIGKLSKGYVQNMPDVGHWRRAIEDGELPVARGMELSTDDLLRGRIIEQLMTDYRCDLSATAASFGETPQGLLGSIDALDELVREGFVVVNGWNVQVSAKGRPFVRLAAAAFDAYLEGSSAGTKRHSLAV
ncbi:oxygen-independent coproporphyrinogen III oxidase [Roseibium sp.]|uniref:oxygen-independent coproporphyrinogen III oxidase n=1 Tax=Roseibium sp. TaxID=1936156 RepID=UPI003A97A60D